jgi:hypothetical protein
MVFACVSLILYETVTSVAVKSIRTSEKNTDMNGDCASLAEGVVMFVAHAQVQITRCSGQIPHIAYN